MYNSRTARLIFAYEAIGFPKSGHFTSDDDDSCRNEKFVSTLTPSTLTQSINFDSSLIIILNAGIGNFLSTIIHSFRVSIYS
jgi:hypothetical protein